MRKHRKPLRKSSKGVVYLPAGRLAFLAFLLMISGCGSTRPIKYYQITYPTPTTGGSETIDAVLMVRTFEASHLYMDDKIVYGLESPEMGTYEYQRWAEPPVEILQDSLVRGLRASGRFKGVYRLRSDISGQFVLGGRLYDFKEVEGATIVARLSYETRLRDRKTGLTVWDHIYNRDEPVTEKTVAAFVQAMDKNVRRSVQEVQTGLEEYFRAHPAK